MVYSFVPVLQAAKERRQPIIVTHSPNIAVSGNAELMVALKEHDCLPAGRLMSTMLRRWCAKCRKEQKSGDIRAFAKVTGLSFGGCYVLMTSTSARGTPVNLVIQVNSMRFRVQGLVKTSDPCLAMGIAFRTITSADKEYLKRNGLEGTEVAGGSIEWFPAGHVALSLRYFGLLDSVLLRTASRVAIRSIIRHLRFAG